MSSVVVVLEPPVLQEQLRFEEAVEAFHLEVISRPLGHSSTVVTERAYAELFGTTVRNELLAVLGDVA